MTKIKSARILFLENLGNDGQNPNGWSQSYAALKWFGNEKKGIAKMPDEVKLPHIKQLISNCWNFISELNIGANYLTLQNKRLRKFKRVLPAEELIFFNYCLRTYEIPDVKSIFKWFLPKESTNPSYQNMQCDFNYLFMYQMDDLLNTHLTKIYEFYQQLINNETYYGWLIFMKHFEEQQRELLNSIKVKEFPVSKNCHSIEMNYLPIDFDLDSGPAIPPFMSKIELYKKICIESDVLTQTERKKFLALQRKNFLIEKLMECASSAIIENYLSDVVHYFSTVSEQIKRDYIGFRRSRLIRMCDKCDILEELFPSKLYPAYIGTKIMPKFSKWCPKNVESPGISKTKPKSHLEKTKSHQEKTKSHQEKIKAHQEKAKTNKSHQKKTKTKSNQVDATVDINVPSDFDPYQLVWDSIWKLNNTL